MENIKDEMLREKQKTRWKHWNSNEEKLMIDDHTIRYHKHLNEEDHGRKLRIREPSHQVKEL